ncbi:MAG: GAF domain-containing protein, partial [Myxococcota bacterium]
IARIQQQVGGEPSIIAEITNEVAQGNFDRAGDADRGRATGIMGSVTAMMTALKDSRDTAMQKDWLDTGIARLNRVMSGDPDLVTLAARVISEISTYLDAQIGAFYCVDDGDCMDDGAEPTFVLLGSYAYSQRKNLSNRFALGEGLVGQAALEKKQILLSNVPDDYVTIISGLGERVPRFICVSPLSHEDEVKGVIEIGTLSEMSAGQLEYLELAMSAVAVSVDSAQARGKLARSLQESRQLAGTLQAQQAELRAANEELEAQSRRLEQSERTLQAQHEELEAANEELEQKNRHLDRSRRDVERASAEVESKVEELALASKYKSEFLANMSHELRTPLNSLLLLARGLM